MSTPYVFVEGPRPCHICAGSQLVSSLGYHAFFVTFVPFIPSFLSDDFVRMSVREASRIQLIVSRQIRFLNDLSSCKTDAVETFDLRFVSIPQAGQPYNKLYVFFVGKAFDRDRDRARMHAVELWHKFRSYFPLEDPFNYPLHTIIHETDESGRTVPSHGDLWQLALQPIALGDSGSQNLIEIRKYEDRDPMLSSPTEGKEQFVGYYPHPFSPTIDFSAMSRFLETFALQSQKCVASICLRPTSLALEEQQSINRMMQQYARLLEGAETAGNWLAQYRQERFDDLVRTFDPVINQRNHLFMVKIQVLGEQNAPFDVVAALGSEIMNNTTNEPRLWSEVCPVQPGEAEIAYTNFALMEYQPWGRVDTDSPLWRLSSLVTSYESVGAFRLPVPPESGHMPGIRVRDEPFVLPATLATPQESQIEDRYVPLGWIMHRGTRTETEFYVALSQLKRHGLVAGSTGSGKTNTCLHLLTELWHGTPSIPFLVIYPIDKPDYRLLQADPTVRDQLLIFTVGDENTSPFRFNPFDVPPGILVRTHMSLLMRAFTAAFTLWEPLPAIYRAALRKAYQEAGFCDLRKAKGGDPGTQAPLLSRFYELLLQASAEMTREYGREIRGNIRQAAEIRMRDLLQNAGHVLNVREGAPWEQILERPTVMEIGRVGSSEDTALVMGFLLMSLTSYLSHRHRGQAKPQQHITLIEEAHRLMSSNGSGASRDGVADPRGKASEDFANMLAEVRGFGEGMLIAEQIPTQLVSGAIGNTYLKIMHWLEEQASFNLFCDIMNLNGQQREYARTLPVGQAIVRGVAGRPVLVQVKNYLDQFQHADDTPIIDDSDEALRTFMTKQLERLGVRLPILSEFALPDGGPEVGEVAIARSEVRDGTWRLARSDLVWVLRMPMPSCAFCKARHRTAKCRYGGQVRAHLFEDETFRSRCRPDLEGALASENGAVMWHFVSRIGEKIERRLAGVDSRECREVVYCYLAHEIEDHLRVHDLSAENRKHARSLLVFFESNYGS